MTATYQLTERAACGHAYSSLRKLDSYRRVSVRRRCTMRNTALRIAVRHSDFSHLLWYLVIVMIFSVGWLFYMVISALR
jgi:hypothetical protein